MDTELATAHAENETLRAQVAALTTERALYPSKPGETRAGFSTGGVCVEGRTTDIDAVKKWHHDATAWLDWYHREYPKLEARIARLANFTDADVEAVAEAYNKAEANPVMRPCSRCAGKGYHHGFGEYGLDPDWCETCGGGGVELADKNQSIRAALAAYVSREAE